MKNPDFKLKCIVLAGLETGGYSYLGRSRFQVPVCHKPLINWLVDDLFKLKLEEKDENPVINNITIVTGKDFDEKLREQFENNPNKKKIDFIPQEPFQKLGTFEAIKIALKEPEKEQFPIAIFYGDSLLHDDFLKELIKKVDEIPSSVKNEPWIVWGLFSIPKEGDTNVCLDINDYPLIKKIFNKYKKEFQINSYDEFIKHVHEIEKKDLIKILRSKSPKNKEFTNYVFNRIYNRIVENAKIDNISEDYLEKNYHITVLTKKSKRKSVEKKQSIYSITTEDIIDILDKPPYIKLLHKEKDDGEFLYDTGFIIISEGAYKLLDEYFEKSEEIRTSRGVYSIQNAIRKILIDEKGLNIYGVVGNFFDHYWDVNFPWHQILLSEYLANRMTILPESKDLGEGYDIVTPDELMDKSKFPNIHENVNIDGKLIIHEDKDIRIGNGVYIDGPCVFGKGCIIHNNVSIHNSYLGNDVEIYPNAEIINSIIMSGSKIFHKTLVPYSILGENVVISNNSSIACHPLSKNAKYYSDDEIIAHDKRFGVLIGDFTKIGMDVKLEHGRKIGTNCNIDPKNYIQIDIPEYTRVRSKKDIVLEPLPKVEE